jgi:hypothetical protein
MVSESRKTVIDFCLARAEEAPIHTRIKLYRGLADICGNEMLSVELEKCADGLEAAEHRCQEFAFRIRLSKPQTGGTR